MSQPGASAAAAPARIDDCWNRIGVRGDHSCAKLETHIHCRNCPVYAAAAGQLLNRAVPAGHLDNWSEMLARPQAAAAPEQVSVVIFRVGPEWLALPTVLFEEIAGVRAIHSLPHRRSGGVLGVANIRGELLVCIGLRDLLGLEAAPAERGPGRDQGGDAAGRLLVIQWQGSRAVFPVEQVHGIERFAEAQLAELPATLAKTAATYTKAILPWRGKSVGLLDEQSLFHTLTRSLALATAT